MPADGDPRDSASPYGVLAFIAWDHDWNRRHFPLEEVRLAADLMREAGIGFVRMDFLWSDIEPRPGRFDFARYEQIVDMLRDRELRVLGILHYNPAWRSAPWNQAPEAERYSEFARSVVRRFKDRVRYWEIWNEPDHPEYWLPQDGLKAYSRLLRGSYAALKEEDPSCRVLLGGLATDIAAHLRRIYEQAGRAVFDVANIHPFVNPLEPRPLERLRDIFLGARQVMAEFGDEEKPLWMTEVGCPGTAQPAPDWWLGRNPNEEEQARWVEALYGEAVKWEGVDKIFWAFLRDTPGHFKNGVDFFGLLRADLSAKPSYRAYQKIAGRTRA